MVAPRHRAIPLCRMAVAYRVQATRAFSTALPLRISPSRPAHGGPSNAFPPAGRVNPLVGNNALPEPAPDAIASAASLEQDAPAPGARSSPDADASPYGAAPPRPPPPPPPESSGEAASGPKPTTHAYNAVDYATVDLSNLVNAKASDYKRSLGSSSNPLNQPNVRAKAVVGRTVFIADRLTPQSAPTPILALRVLERMCRDQKVKSKYHSQKFHERKGLRKKRLRSQRWRARFKAGFKEVVSRVMELKKQGW